MGRARRRKRRRRRRALRVSLVLRTKMKMLIGCWGQDITRSLIVVMLHFWLGGGRGGRMSGRMLVRGNLPRCSICIVLIAGYVV